VNLYGFASIQFARLSIAATPVWINTVQFVGGSLRTKSGQQDATSARISSLRFASDAALDESADAGNVI
jgi:hypothetical protein